MAQVQCPNCGGYRVFDFGPDYLDPQTGEKVEPRQFTLCLFGAFGVSAYAALALGFIFWVDLAMGTKLILTVLVLTLGVLIVSAGCKWERQKPRKEDLARQWRYECWICGYEWSWREGQPRPRATVRPDLIEKGHQKLQEEEEEDWRRLWD